jgi:DNA-binding response OmpR family regulator
MEHSALEGSSAPHHLRQDGPIPEPPYVLVVDDQQIIRDFVKRCLEGVGFTVKQAGSAESALELMTTTPASVVLVDVRMPINDGLWLAERLRAEWPGVPIIMISGLEDDDTIAASRRLGAFDYLTKPIPRKQLLAAVHRAMGTTDEPQSPETIETASTITELQSQLEKMEAEYSLEYPVRCPSCGDTISSLKAVRLLRAHVNFTSTMPRRGRLVVCPTCLAILPAELGNL